MEQRELAEFRVRIFSAENATWQGQVESGGDVFFFQSELQLLRWLCRKYPALGPETGSDRL